MSNDNVHKLEMPRGLRIVTMILLVTVTTLLVTIIVFFVMTGPRNEKSLVEGKAQALWLDNGQVYFGKVSTVNSQYMVLSNAQYLRFDCTLEKERPEVVINRSNVVVWENLTDQEHVDKVLSEVLEAAQATGQCAPGSESDNAGQEPVVNNGSGNSNGSMTDTGNDTPDTPVSNE